MGMKIRWAVPGAAALSPRIAVALAMAFIAALATAVPASALTFSGVLRDRDGNPVPQQTVQLSSPGGPFLSANTDDFGHFAVNAAPGGYQLGVAQCMGCFPQQPNPSVPNGFWNLSGPTVQLDGDLSQDLTLQNQLLTVTVLDPNGDPLPGASVSANEMGSPSFELYPGGRVSSGDASSFATSDSNGTARLTLFHTRTAAELFAPAVSISINPPPGSGQFPFTETLPELTTDLAITLPRNTVPRDTTPPLIEPHVNGTLGRDGWYTSDVGLTWNVSDAESGIASSTGCDAMTLTADASGRTFTCVATNGAGLHAERLVTIKRDALAPAITHAISPARPDGAAGWYVTAPTVTFTCDDPTSGVASCTAPVLLGESAQPQTVSGTATDAAGNSAHDASGPLLVDLTDPAVTCPTRPTFFLGEQNAQVTASVSDDASGPAAARVTAPVATDAVGTSSADLTGRDRAGRTHTVSCTYTVVYRWSGFLAPLGDQTHPHAGNAVPVKFSLSGNQGLRVLAPGLPTSRQVACATGAPIGNASSTSSAGASTLTYDPTTDTYVYVWKTDAAWTGTCRELAVGLADGTVHRTVISFG